MTSLRITAALCAALSLCAAETALKLPAAPVAGATLAAALKGRATVRTLTGPGLSLGEAGQLLWAAQGENRPGHRTVPSAHARYPLELYLVTAGGAELPAGLYHYLPASHSLARLGDGGPDTLFGRVKGMQPWIKDAPAVFVMAGDPTRIERSGRDLTFYEAGAAAQCLLLQASGLGLGAGTAAGIDLDAVARSLDLPAGLLITTVLPVGRAK